MPGEENIVCNGVRGEATDVDAPSCSDFKR